MRTLNTALTEPLQSLPNAPDQRRVVIISISPTIHAFAGNAAYLASFAATCRRLGYQTELLVASNLPRERVALRLVKKYVRSFDRIRIHGMIGIRSWLYLRPWVGWGLLRRLLPSRKVPAVVDNSTAGSSEGWVFPRLKMGDIRWLQRQLRRRPPDILVANYFNAADVFLHLDMPCKRLILLHDVLAARADSFARAGLAADVDARMLPWEARNIRTADLNLAITRAEAEYLSAHFSAPAAVFPFAQPRVDARRQQMPANKICLFVASNNAPNRTGLEWLTKEVWPRVQQAEPSAELHIVGRVPPPAGERVPAGVRYLGTVPSLDGVYRDARVAVVPLLAGSGLKIKLVEAMAHATPVVATPVGADGVDFEQAESRALSVCKEAVQFAQAICAVLTLDQMAWLRSSGAASQFALRYSSQQQASDALRVVLSDLVEPSA